LVDVVADNFDGDFTDRILGESVDGYGFERKKIPQEKLKTCRKARFPPTTANHRHFLTSGMRGYTAKESRCEMQLAAKMSGW